MKDLTIILSHARDLTYLFHNLDILDRLGFSRDQIWIDGYFCKCDKSIGVSKITSHELPHGERSYDLLSEAETNHVIIVDSDFMCADPTFWSEAKLKLIYNPIVSIEKPWHFSIPMLTTPFVAYQRRTVLEMVPVRKAWNHFSLALPGLSNAVFDHLAFVFFTALCTNKCSSIDSWDPKKRKFKFCHLWDSRHSYDENFEDFDKEKTDFNYVYLAHGISKYIFHYVAGEIPEFGNRTWEYMKTLKKRNIEIYKEYSTQECLERYPFGYLLDAFKNMEAQIDFKPDWLTRFKSIENKFYEILEN